MADPILKLVDGTQPSVTAAADVSLPHAEPDTHETQWSAGRFKMKSDEKEIMARYFAQHEFLLPPIGSTNSASLSGAQRGNVKRDTVASIIVNQGTTPNQVVKDTLRWTKENHSLGPFFLTWYSPGHLVPETLREFRRENPHMLAAARLFLMPGEVDLETESVSGPDAEKFANALQRRFTYAFLSAYAFDIYTGHVYFYLSREVTLQQACATRFAATKLLFVDSSKFKNEGEYGYSIHELLKTANTAAIYTVSSGAINDAWILDGFRNLGESVFDRTKTPGNRVELKRLCLRIVGLDGSLLNEGESVIEGVLR